MSVLGVAEGQVVSTPEPGVFAKAWLTAWNRRDVDAVLAHFHDDVVFTSPVAAQVMPDSNGVVRGKAALARILVRRTEDHALPALRTCRYLSGRVGAGHQLPQSERRPSERSAGVRRRSCASWARDVPIAQLANRCDPGGDVGVHDLGAAAVGHRDRHDDLDAFGDLGEIRYVQLSLCPQRCGGFL